MRFGENKPFDVEYRIIHRKGSIRYFLKRGWPVYGSDAKPEFIDGVILDITERRRAEAALQEARHELELRVKERTAALEQKNRELQDFALVASHDLAGSLRKIKTFGAMLVNRCGGGFLF